MHYAYEFTVEPAHVVSSPLVESIKLAAGTLTRVQIFFPEGCSRMVRCYLKDVSQQIAPTNPDGYYALDGNVADASLYHSLDYNVNQLYFVGWNIGAKYSHIITVLIDVKGVDEPDTNGIMILMKETIDRLIDLMRSVF